MSTIETPAGVQPTQANPPTPLQVVFSQLLSSVYRVEGVYHPRYFEVRATSGSHLR